MKIKNNCDLRSCYLCKNCLPAWIPAIEGNRKVIKYAKGEMIFTEGDPVTGMYFVYEGVVKVHKKWGEEKELILRFAQKGDILGHRGLGSDFMYPISATTLEPVVVCCVSLSFFYDTLKVNPTFSLELLNFFAAELKLSEQRMRNMAHMPAKGRIVQAILSLSEKFGLDDTGSLNLELSRNDFASYVGITYETAFRLLTEMDEEGLIQMNKKDIKVPDLAKLKQVNLL